MKRIAIERTCALSSTCCASRRAPMSMQATRALGLCKSESCAKLADARDAHLSSAPWYAPARTISTKRSLFYLGPLSRQYQIADGTRALSLPGDAPLSAEPRNPPAKRRPLHAGLRHALVMRLARSGLRSAPRRARRFAHVSSLSTTQFGSCRRHCATRSSVALLAH